MAKKKRKQLSTIKNTNIEERYVAALLLLAAHKGVCESCGAQTEEILVPEAHEMVDELLEEIDLDVTLTKDFLADYERSMH